MKKKKQDPNQSQIATVEETLNSLKKYDLILIRWRDALIPGFGWMNEDLDEEDNERDLYQLSMGFFIKKFNKSIFMAQTINELGRSEYQSEVCGGFMVPTEMIDWIRILDNTTEYRINDGT